MNQEIREKSPELNQDLLKTLPLELIIDILSRLPVRTIISCKCVDKSWLDLIETHEVVKSHLSKSVPGLLASHENVDGSILYRFFEFEEETADMNTECDVERHKLHYSPATPWLDIPSRHRKDMIGSVNGLLLWQEYTVDNPNPQGPFICNPITREYIKLPQAQDSTQSRNFRSFERIVTYGFGASEKTGQHKVLRVCGTGRTVFNYEYQVYTLGTGSWRTIDPSRGAGPSMEDYHDSYIGSVLFLKGKLHWLSTVPRPYIFSLDLETELFCTFSPPLPVKLESKCYFSLCALQDSLCLCESTRNYEKIVVWLVKEDKFWAKEFVIRYNPPGHCPFYWLPVQVLKVFEDGDILVEWCGLAHFTRPEKDDTWDWLTWGAGAIIHTPSFLSLKRFEMESVISY